MIKQHTVAKDLRAVAATIFGTLLLATVIDPYLTIGSPWVALAINAAIPLFVALVVLAASGRWLIALPAGALVSALLVVADHFKVEALYNNLLFADLKLIPELAKQPELVVGFAHLGAKGWALVVAGVLAVAGAVFFALRRPPIGRWSRVAVAIAAFLGATAIWQHKLSHSVPSIGWILPMQIHGAEKAGAAGNVLLGGMASSKVKPHASDEAIAAFWADPLVKAARARLSAQDTQQRPDIVVVQSESLFEPSLMCGFADTPVLRNLASLPGKGFQNLTVPVFGHRTLQTEFEMLSGFPVRFAPNSLFSYYELVDRPIPALPRTLGALGYRTIALHPSKRSFWRRDYAFPAMGFDTFIDGGAYVRGSDYSRFGWVSDEAMTRTILSQLDDDNAVPTMVFAVSIENHGPWGGKGPPAPAKQLPVPDKVQGTARVELLDYLERSKEADDNLGVLIEALKQRRRPTVVVFYGDHLPALHGVYAQTCFKDGKPPAKHSPPLRVWSNFAPAETVDGDTTSYLMPARLLRMAGLPLEGQFLAGAIADEIQRDPKVKAQDKKRILDGYAHVAAREVLETKVPDERSTAFVTKQQANDAFFGMQAGAPKLARRMEGDEVKGALWPAQAGEVTFSLGKRVADTVIRSLSTSNKKCEAKPMAMEAWADGQLIARSWLDDRAVAVQALQLSGVDKLTLRLQRDPAAAACADVVLEVPQMLCYSSSCDVPGRSDSHGKRAAVAGRVDFDAMNAALAAGTEGDAQRVADMMARSTGHDAAQPLRITADHKVFLHPSVEKAAWIEFDVQSLSFVALTPSIQPLSESCRRIPKGGVVGIDVAIDGKVIDRIDVDRNFHGTVPVPLHGAQRLRLTIDAGNGVTWCDWASVGFASIQRAAVGAGGK